MTSQIFPVTEKESSVMGDHSFLAGAIAGLTSRIVTAPFDVVKIRMQLQQEPIRNAGKGGRYTGLLQAFANLYAEEGFRTFYRGNMPAVMTWGWWKRTAW